MKGSLESIAWDTGKIEDYLEMHPCSYMDAVELCKFRYKNWFQAFSFLPKAAKETVLLVWYNMVR